jgi:cytoskeletal protein CcmA (bactofilin family)
VKGKIEVAELLVLKATAVINGDIITGKLVVEPGAVFNGSCKMGATIKDIKIGNNGLTGAIPQQEAKSN